MLAFARIAVNAAKVDQGVLTPAEAKVQIAEILTDTRQRLLQRQQAQAGIAANLAAADAANAAASQARIEANRPYQLPIPLIPRSVQTHCNNYGSTINCTSY